MSKMQNSRLIATISKLQLEDSEVGFYFSYPSTESEVKNLDGSFGVKLTWTSHGSTVSFHLRIDYLIAEGVNLCSMNMTSYQSHTMGVMEAGDTREPTQHAELLLFLNGFSELSLSGSIVYNYIP